MRIEELSPGRLAAVSALIAERQSDPDTHVAYLASAADTIAAELSALGPDGLRGVLIAIDADGTVAGTLGAEHDVDPPRVWWWGPFAVPTTAPRVVDRLYDEARARLPEHVREEELAGDARSGFLAAFAHRHGFAAEEGSVLLERGLAAPVPADDDSAMAVRPPSPGERSVAAGVHGALFPGTHSGGPRALRDEPGRIARVAVADGELLGYAVAEVQADGAGYLDFLGVVEHARGLGVGGRLVAAVCGALRERACSTVFLTVRESNAAARRLYARLGFREERLLRPWRKGFFLDGARGSRSAEP